MVINENVLLNHVFGITFVIIIFALAYGYLKPHRLHKQRGVSTLALKVTYLLYLFVLLIVVYFSSLVNGGMEKIFFGIEVVAMLLVLYVPTIGLFSRKMERFQKHREKYNYFFSVINVLSIVAILTMYFV